METKDRGIVKGRIALQIYDSCIASSIIAGDGECTPAKFKQFFLGHLPTTQELDSLSEKVYIFFDIYSSEILDYDCIDFRIYVRDNATNSNLVGYFGNTMDCIITIIDDCIKIFGDEADEEIYPDAKITPINHGNYIGMSQKYIVVK